MTKKTTSHNVASKASSVLTSSNTGASSKTAAGSALSQVDRTKVTSARAASAASTVLRDGRTSAASKTAAASALSQRMGSKKK